MPQVPGNTISGAGGYGSYPGNPYRDRYVWITMPDGEIRHLAVTAGIGLIARNPYVSIGVGVLHGLSHVFEPGHHPAGPSFTEWITGTYDPSSPGGGGPGHSLTSTNPPPSLEATGASLAQHGKTEGPARSSKRGSRPRRKKCPPGHYWSKKHGRCVSRIFGTRLQVPDIDW
jgi:hypothetical protein